MAKVSFNEFLLQCWDAQIFDATPVGDFIYEAIADDSFPAVASWGQLSLYLVDQSAPPDVQEAAGICYFIWYKTHGARKKLRAINH
jgi:hypothetical protein